MFTIDYMVYRREHLFRGNMARIIGMIEVPGVPYEQKEATLRSLAAEARNINGRI